MEAILNNLKATSWYTQQKKAGGRVGFQFIRHTVPSLRPESDEEVEMKLKDPVKYSNWMKEIGYWKIKKVELDWLQV